MHTIPVDVEGLGMASCLVSPGKVLLTGGSSRGGRGTAIKILNKDQGGWRFFSLEISGDMGKEDNNCFLSLVVLHLTASIKKIKIFTQSNFSFKLKLIVINS